MPMNPRRHTQHDCTYIPRALKTRLRKRHDYQTAEERYAALRERPDKHYRGEGCTSKLNSHALLTKLAYSPKRPWSGAGRRDTRSHSLG